MKICILSIVNIKHMSLISLYTSFLENNSIDYDIIYVDKYNEKEPINAKNIYRFPIHIDRKWSKLRKLYEYWGFKKYAQEIINTQNYDFVIVWRTETAILFSNFLYKRMKGKYCINIRDYCMEKNLLIYKKVKKVISGAKFTTLSSEGFKTFLPKEEYITVHSYNETVLESINTKKQLVSLDKPINICFIGYVRFFDIDKRLIDALGNDSRYNIQFFGEGSQYLKSYAEERKIYNIEFVEGFRVEDTVKLLNKADVINNLYGFNDIALDTAISTRYYYSLHLNIPILVFKNTFMEELSTKIGIGYPTTGDFSRLGDEFYEWYHSLNTKILRENCNREINRILKENNEFYEVIEKTFC